FQSLKRVKLDSTSFTVVIGRLVSTSWDTEREAGRNRPITTNSATTISREISHSITRVIRELSRNGPRPGSGRPQERKRISGQVAPRQGDSATVGPWPWKPRRTRLPGPEPAQT